VSVAVGYVGAPVVLEALVFNPDAGLAGRARARPDAGTELGLVAWSPDAPQPRRPIPFLTSRSPADEANLRSFAGALRVHAWVARRGGASPPYCDDRLPLATIHDGALNGFEPLRFALVGRIRPEVLARIGGAEPSEWLHALVASALAGGAPLDQAVSWALSEIAGVRRVHGLRRASVANLVVSDGERLAAVRFTFDAGQDDPAQPGAWDERGLHYAFARTLDGAWHVGGNAARADGLVVTSAPPPGVPGWFEVPEYTMLVAEVARGRLGLRWHPLEL
jgi:hypothetical protein